MMYDIRNPEKAKETLSNMTGLSVRQWDQLVKLREGFEYVEDFIQYIVDRLVPVLPEYADLNFVFIQITTSSDGCKSIRENGLCNLQEVCGSPDSELRQFLDLVGVKIEFENAILKHKGETYCIEFDNGKVGSAAWAVGRKLYYDFCICGFLSIDINQEYGGYVHKRPEFLSDVDKLLKTQYTDLWVRDKRAYQIVACVNSNDILSDGDETDEERVMRYLCKAYVNAYEYQTEEIVLCKNDTYIPAEAILSIESFEYWK